MTSVLTLTFFFERFDVLDPCVLSRTFMRYLLRNACIMNALRICKVDHILFIVILNVKKDLYEWMSAAHLNYS